MHKYMYIYTCIHTCRCVHRGLCKVDIELFIGLCEVGMVFVQVYGSLIWSPIDFM